MSRLLIDVGHRDNPADPGAVGKVVEYDHNLAIANALRNYVDFEQIPDNTGSLINTIKLINSKYTADDVLFSIHTNAGGGDGIEIWYYGGSENSRKKAQNGCDIIATEANEPNRGAKSDLNKVWSDGSKGFGIVRNTTPWAFLLECDFVDDPTGDVADPAMVDKYARGIAKWAATFGFPTRNLEPEQPKQPEQPAVDPRDAEISRLNGEVQNKIAQLNRVSSELAAAVSERDSYKKTAEECDARVADIEKRKNEALGQVGTLTSEKTKLQEEFDKLTENTAKAVTEYQTKIKTLEDWKLNHKCDASTMNFWDACKLVIVTMFNKSKRTQIINEAKERINMKPGYKTTEFWLNLVVQILGGATVLEIVPNEGAIAKIVALVLMVLANFGYQYNRAKEKVASTTTSQITK